MTKTRRGFTLIEILIVIAIMGIVMMLALPKAGNMNDRNRMRSAKDGISAKLSTARAAAIATGRPSKFYLDGNRIRRSTFDGSVETAQKDTIYLDRQFGVQVVSSSFSVVFDGRGMTSSAGNVIKFTRGALTDSICISPIGLINRHGCAK